MMPMYGSLTPDGLEEDMVSVKEFQSKILETLSMLFMMVEFTNLNMKHYQFSI